MRLDFKLSHELLSIDEVSTLLLRDNLGAQVVFVGTVRNNSMGQVVTHLEFEAYESMAIKELETIASQLREAYPIETVVLHHRLGRVNVGETAVVAGVGAPHREAAFEACRQLMNRLKISVPIWKKEFTASGAVWVTPTP